MVFPVVIYNCESWTVKKAEHWRTDAFKLWCWRRILKVPWKARRSNWSILRKSTLNTRWKDWCWSWSSSILVTNGSSQLVGKVPDAAKDIEQEKRASGDEMAGWHRWFKGHELGQTLGNGEVQGDLGCCSSWGHKQSDTTGWLNDNWSINVSLLVVVAVQ